jgi:excisionase family DNA binding protein
MSANSEPSHHPPPEIGQVQFLTVAEVAKLMRVSKMTVYRLIRQGDLAAFRVGRAYRMREEDIHRYLDSRYTEAG